jgi:hypothetical protein
MSTQAAILNILETGIPYTVREMYEFSEYLTGLRPTNFWDAIEDLRQKGLVQIVIAEDQSWQYSFSN